MTGEAKETDLYISGAGGFDLLDLKTERMKIDISGAAHARVYATEELDVEISGAGAGLIPSQQDYVGNWPE